MITRREFIKRLVLTGSSLPFFLAAYRNSGGGTAKFKKKAIVIGIDGLDPVLVSRMMKAGELPNFTRMAQSGTFSSLSTSNPPQSPVAWSCIATGNNPGMHGMFDFLKRDRATYMPELSILEYRNNIFKGPSFVNPRRSPALWELLSEAGIPSTVIRWPITFPPADISGKILSGLGTPDIKGELGTHTLYTSKDEIENNHSSKNTVTVKFYNNRAISSISGPKVRGMFESVPSVVPMSITRDPAKKLITIEINGQAVPVYEKNWSKWIQLKFKVNLVHTISGVCRFFLDSTSDPFSLYMTPIQIDPSDPCYPISQPREYAPGLARRFGCFYTLGIPEDTKALMENHIDDEAFLDMCDTIVAEQESIFFHELENFKNGLLANVFFTTDRIAHIYWAAHDHSHPAYNPEIESHYGGVIKEYYRRMDRILSHVVTLSDPDTLIIVCSDHGFASFKKAVHLNSWLAEQGFMSLQTTLPRYDTEGGPLFQCVNWRKTRAYALGLNSIYLNLKGREQYGIVETSQYRRTILEIKDAMERWKDPDTGERVVLSAFPSSDIYSGPFSDNGPDIVVGFNRGYRMSWQSALGGTPARILEPNTGRWTGDHCMDPSLVSGTFLANRKFDVSKISLLDIAPTIMKHFGIKANTEGSSLKLMG